jgi:predicted acylesterase/phospholipase RssA
MTNAGPRRTLADHLDPAQVPKRLLALDGGGVRGIVTLQFLRSIESELRRRRNDPTYVLSDYFDLIGGTSTGAIIAAALALGMSVDEVEVLYLDLATRIFRKPWFRIGALIPKFGITALQSALQDTYGADTTIGSPKIRTGLMIMSKRMDRGSAWPLTNNPRDPYFLPASKPGQRRIGNTNMLLWQVVRASTAAPSFFKPEALVVGQGLDPATGAVLVDSGEFVDGGVTTANNPALQLLRTALLKGFEFQWPLAEDKLLLVSIGTGLRNKARGKATGFSATAGAFAFKALLSLMDDCNEEVETTLQWLSASSTARRINGQIGDLAGDVFGGRPLLTYARYNIYLTEQWMQKELAEPMPQKELDKLSAMDQPRNMTALKDLAHRAAGKFVSASHFPAHFDPP